MGWLRKVLGITAADNARKAQESLNREQREAEAARNMRIEQGKRSIDASFDKFDNRYYEGLRKAFTDENRSQLDGQVANARKDATYALARNGTLASSLKNVFEADIQKQSARAMQDVAAKASDIERQQRGALEDSRTNILNSLNATGDAEAASRQAVSRVDAIAQPQAYSPLADVIKLTSVNLNNQLAQERVAMDMGGPQPTFWTGAFGPRPGSTVTRR